MSDAEPEYAPSRPLSPEQQVLTEEEPAVSESSGRIATRERSFSTSSKRSGHYDAQRLGKRPASVASRKSSKGKGKRVNVDFADLPSGDERYRPLSPVSPIEPESSTAAAERPQHMREDSYTNYSRPDVMRRDNSKRSSLGGTGNTMSSLPTHPEAVHKRSSLKLKPSATGAIANNGMTALPAHPEAMLKNKQNRVSMASSSSRQLRPPIHQSDLERADNTSSEESAPVPPFSQSVSGDHMSGRRFKELPPAPPDWLRELYTVSYLILFSFLGTLARTGLEWLTFYPGAIIITPVVWANFAGSLFLGFLTEDVKLFQDEWAEPIGMTSRTEKRTSKQSRMSKRSTFSQDFERWQKQERLKIKKSVPLYTGLTTGFCGCFTSFSIFARDMFLALSNDTPSPINHPSLPPAGADAISVTLTLPRHGGYSFMAVVAVIVTTLTLSIGGFVAGAQLAELLERVTPRVPTRFTRLFLDRLVVLLGFGCWLGAIFLLIWPPDRPGGTLGDTSWNNETWRGIELFSMVFCPVGCLLRYYASMFMNPLEPSFPMGTFAVNMLGTAIMSMAWDLQRVSLDQYGSIGGGLLGCQALEGIIDGFTGCLTTVSTWVAETCALRRKYGWIYAMGSVVGAMCLVLVIMGPVRWTIGWSDPTCITSYTNKY